jgi:NAD(P)-dependent dehydrogenase (short-subunit alcohol dehydrogenase family)
MNKHYGNVVLVTGASSGIGKATAEYLAKQGYKVYGTSRKAVPLTEGVGGGTGVGASGGSGASGGFVRMLQMDVCSEESVKAAIQQILAVEGEIGIVVNNAGMGIAGSVEDTSPEEAFLQLDTNFFGMHRVIRQVLPAMRKQGRGLIVNMSSVGAVFPIPFQSMYVASKAAIEGMSGSLRNELRPFGVKVAMVEPGDTKTGFTGSRVFVKAGGPDSAYSEQSRRSIAVMERDESNGPDPVVVARVIGKIIRRKNPPLCVAVGLQYKLFLFLKRFLPGKAVSFVVSKMYEG